MAAGGFDADAIRSFIRNGFAAAGACGCSIEIMLKEMMTVGNDLTRLFRWTEIAMRESENAGAK